MLKELMNSLVSAFAGQTPEEQYNAGRAYATKKLSTQNPPSGELLRQLWAQSDVDRTFGGNGQFDRGISDVLSEAGYRDPADPCSCM